MCVSGRLKCGLIRWTGRYDNISFGIKTPYILCDSKSVLQSIESFNSKHPIILKILEWLFLLQKRGKVINFCWVPAHVGITVNERADRLAKEAAVNSIPRPYPIPFSDFIPAITTEIRKLLAVPLGFGVEQ